MLTMMLTLCVSTACCQPLTAAMQRQVNSSYLDVLHAHGSMQDSKRQEAAKVFRHEDCVEAHNRNAGGFYGAQHDKGGISNVELAVHATQQDARQAVDWQQVDDERVSSPRCNLQTSQFIQNV